MGWKFYKLDLTSTKVQSDPTCRLLSLSSSFKLFASLNFSYFVFVGGEVHLQVNLETLFLLRICRWWDSFPSEPSRSLCWAYPNPVSLLSPSKRSGTLAALPCHATANQTQLCLPRRCSCWRWIHDPWWTRSPHLSFPFRALSAGTFAFGDRSHPRTSRWWQLKKLTKISVCLGNWDSLKITILACCVRFVLEQAEKHFAP